eukprot:720379-Rhodomonas_salina.7
MRLCPHRRDHLVVQPVHVRGGGVVSAAECAGGDGSAVHGLHGSGPDPPGPDSHHRQPGLLELKS